MEYESQAHCRGVHSTRCPARRWAGVLSPGAGGLRSREAGPRHCYFASIHSYPTHTDTISDRNLASTYADLNLRCHVYPAASR